MTEPVPETRLERIERERAARKAELSRAAEGVLADDLEKISELEVEHGDSNVKVIRCDFTPGSRAAIAVRVPKPAELKRYRHRVQVPLGSKTPPPTGEACEELGRACLIYPDKEAFEAMIESRPGLLIQAGIEALELSAGTAAEAGKGFGR